MTDHKENSTRLVYGLPKITLHGVVANDSELKAVAQTQREQINWAEKLLGIPLVWTTTQGEGAKVAILDTGIDLDHPDLATAVIDSEDFSGDDVEDSSGHGTHCAGIIGARLNAVGFVGVAPKSQLLIGKVLDNDGRGDHSWIAHGIDWAVG